MVREQIEGARHGFIGERVQGVMSRVPRHEFVPDEFRGKAHEPIPLPIGYQQTISQPFVVGFMTETLQLKPTDRVLEIGTGSGYQAAILAEMVAEVYTIEIVEPLARRAEAALTRLGYTNIHTRVGDGSSGWPEAAPFDAVIVTCAPEQVPQALVDQFTDGGRMIIPVGGGEVQELVVVSKRDGKAERSAVLPVRFVPMTGDVMRVA